jgi:thiol-disulfide isomerase/thioredoxin
MSAILNDLKVQRFGEDDSLISLNSLREGKAMVLDFWTSKCVKCPAALEKLNEEAGEDKSGEIIYVSCALSQGDGNRDVVSDLVDGEWENMTHVFMDMDNKDAAKAAFSFAQVPFYVIVSASGEIVAQGEPKQIDYQAALKTATASIAAPNGVKKEEVFSLDEDF